MRESRNLKIWHKARTFVNQVYSASRKFPTNELYGIRSQLRRASVSLMANIAEGAGRGGDAEFARFLRIALGSAAEAEALLVIAGDQEFISKAEVRLLNDRLDEIRRMCTTLERVLRASR